MYFFILIFFALTFKHHVSHHPDKKIVLSYVYIFSDYKEPDIFCPVETPLPGSDTETYLKGLGDGILGNSI